MFHLSETLMFPPCSRKPLLFGHLMSIIALGVSLYVHYIAFSMVAANSRSTSTLHYRISLQARYNPVTTKTATNSLQPGHYKLATNSPQPGHYKLATTRSLQNSLQTRYSPVTANSLHKHFAPHTRYGPGTTSLGTSLL